MSILLSSDFDENDELQKRKKARTAFSSEQVQELEKRYQSQKYLPANERQALAETLGLSDQQVNTLFLSMYWIVLIYKKLYIMMGMHV